MRFMCWITKATNTHSEYVILIYFPQQQWLCECTTMLHYMNISCIVSIWHYKNMKIYEYRCTRSSNQFNSMSDSHWVLKVYNITSLCSLLQHQTNGKKRRYPKNIKPLVQVYSLYLNFKKCVRVSLFNIKIPVTFICYLLNYLYHSNN
jgi:hypothetical protein